MLRVYFEMKYCIGISRDSLESGTKGFFPEIFFIQPEHYKHSGLNYIILKILKGLFWCWRISLFKIILSNSDEFRSAQLGVGSLGRPGNSLAGALVYLARGSSWGGGQSSEGTHLNSVRKESPAALSAGDELLDVSFPDCIETVVQIFLLCNYQSVL